MLLTSKEHVFGHAAARQDASANGFPCILQTKHQFDFFCFFDSLNLAGINVFVHARPVVQDGAAVLEKF
jgi:hypothetical protein